MTLTKKDYIIGFIIGFFVGLFITPILYNVGVRSAGVYAGLIVSLPFIFSFGVWLGGFLSRWFAVFAQFGKFVAVGFLNAALDFGVLNFLSLASGVTSGLVLGGVNIPGFAAAATNSYLWNKFWVFARPGTARTFWDLPKFILVTGIGLLLNSAIVVGVTTYARPLGGTSPETWLNVAKATASATVLLWNFLGYKYLVFNGK